MHAAAARTLQSPEASALARPTLPAGVVYADEAVLRLDRTEAVMVAGRRCLVAMPAAYARKPRRSFPLVLTLDADGAIGSAIEIARLMTDTGEVRDSLVVGLRVEQADRLDVPAFARFLADTLLPALRQRYRVADGAVALSDTALEGRAALLLLMQSPPGIDHYIVGNPDGVFARTLLDTTPAQARSTAKRSLSLSGAGAAPLDLAERIGRAFGSSLRVNVQGFDSVSAAGAVVPALAFGLFKALPTGKEYAQGITVLGQPLLVRTLELLVPLLRRFAPAPAPRVDTRYLWRAERMERDFEVFISLPPELVTDGSRRYPLLVALDANIEFATVAETAARLARAGQVQDLIVVGIGTPRAEGHVAFGYRRFEELSPPLGTYRLQDSLGRVFRALYAMRGREAAERLGRAPAFFDFITQDLLPALALKLPVDPERLGLLGHSAAGTFTGYALRQPHSPFRRYASISPGVAISGDWLLQQDWRDPQIPPSQLVAVLGEAEKTNAFNLCAGIPNTEAFAARVALNPAIKVSTACFADETHSSVFPLACANALLTLYPRDERAG
ncbi:alpha/beta hydrolase-fold protein [Hydrocarboniphaga sp.]|uniref:alpha/beta hydrolase-fold protein n=1 Tax=Hydrocarboniphaga sp. TaxID=2033016 RepID=UPI003D0FD0BB